MKTEIQPNSEWTARGLRPVARWSVEKDERGRRRPAMRWAVPQVAMEAVTSTAAVA
jgi:hypothetical protein